MEYCRDLHTSSGSFPGDLSFVYLGVHSSVLSLAQFKDVPFRNVAWLHVWSETHKVASARCVGIMKRKIHLWNRLGQ